MTGVQTCALPICFPVTICRWQLDTTTLYNGRPTLQSFDLTEIDGIREKILTIPGNIAFNIGEYGSNNNIELINATIPKLTGTISMDNVLPLRFNQTGLLCKTYQSDIFNNWLNKEIVSGVGGINEISRVDTSAGYFNIDTLQLAYKVYRMLNQIQVTGGSFDDWQRAVYDHERFASPEIPIYEGGLSKELVFEELFSNANATTPAGNNQPLGTLAGKATMSSKHKGGHINIHVNELSYIMGIVSITPRLDYPQGNDWFTGLKTWNDWHKPHLDQCGLS